MGLSILSVIVVSGWAVWVRRRTWRIRWDAALTMSVVFDGLAFALINPASGPIIGPTLHRLTRICHIRDYFGHLFFICAACCVIYAVACRIAPDGDLEDFMHRIEIPGAITAGAMLASISLSPNLKTTHQTDFFDVPVDFWLRIYWVSYGGLILYLIWVLIRLLLVLRRDPRSRVAADMFILAAAWGALSFLALLVRVLFVPVPDLWIWISLCMASGLASFAAAWSWRGRRRPPRVGYPLSDAVAD